MSLLKLLNLGQSLRDKITLVILVLWSAYPRYRIMTLIFSRREVNLQRRGARVKIYFSTVSDLKEFRNIFIRGYYSWPGHLQVDSIFDLGANVGYSVAYLRLMHPEAMIYAFEPHPEAFARLQKVAEFIQPKIRIYQMAVSDVTGEATLNTSSTTLSSSSLMKLGSLDSSVKVKTVSLDDFCRQYDINSVGLLKVDIEGAEYQVLHRSEIFHHHTTAVILEAHMDLMPVDTPSLLEEFKGYNILSQRRISDIKERYAIKASKRMNQ